MRVLVAPDSFKGSLTAVEAAAAMARGVRRVFPDADVRCLPLADGGEGTVATLVAAPGGVLQRATVNGPLGAPLDAAWGVLGDGLTAVVETAAASGLTCLAPEHYDPLRTSTFGTGEIVRRALDAGYRRLLIGLGGSASNDGGAGLLRALGARFLDADGRELADGGAALARLQRIDLAGLDWRLPACEIVVACDVDNPLCGALGASAVFGPQKGATPAMVAQLDSALARYAEVSTALTGRLVGERPGAGAAGGLGAGLLWFTPAQLRPGIDIVLDALGFDAALHGADLVLTGEGRTDAQTVHGKAPFGVAQRARRAGVPVHCLSGSLGEGAEALYAHGVTTLTGLCQPPMTVRQAMRDAASLLAAASERLCRDRLAAPVARS